MEDIEDLLVMIENEVAQGKKPVFGVGKIVNDSIIFELVERIRNCMPDVLREAKYIVQNSARIQKEESEKAQQVYERAKLKADQILSEHEIVKIAQKEAEIIKAEANEFKSKIIQEIFKDIDFMLSSTSKTLEESLAIIKKAQKNNLDKFGNTDTN
ncbi:MAG: hypothetical protein BWX72_01887 [Firmicutes bacterium ADurb.Bin080]|jgi:phage/plasmid primase-like uncharacterized protein|nr:hypothetical protein [Clostridiales bacterium]OQC12672.1 MAG: hypothetical protein BWX72_01887 [Firmicutes bacterium ADurb.Bin080]